MSADAGDVHHDNCEEMSRAITDPDVPIVYSVVFREYGLVYQDGGTSSLLMTHCPWCGVALPQSLRDQWFEEVDALGLEPGDPEIPLAYASDRWWRE